MSEYHQYPTPSSSCQPCDIATLTSRILESRYITVPSFAELAQVPKHNLPINLSIIIGCITTYYLDGQDMRTKWVWHERLTGTQLTHFHASDAGVLVILMLEALRDANVMIKAKKEAEAQARAEDAGYT